MKAISIVAIATAGFASPLLASDYPSPGSAYVVPMHASVSSPRPLPKAPQVVAALPWTGCYVGGHFGGTVSQDRSGSSTYFGSSGFLGGGQIGCDNQFAPGWVFGLESRAAWTSLDNSHAASVISHATRIPIEIPSQYDLRNEFLASATARLGHTFGDRWLGFVRGGVA